MTVIIAQLEKASWERGLLRFLRSNACSKVKAGVDNLGVINKKAHLSTILTFLGLKINSFA